jgi:hypothetical protein
VDPKFIFYPGITEASQKRTEIIDSVSTPDLSRSPVIVADEPVLGHALVPTFKIAARHLRTAQPPAGHR